MQLDDGLVLNICKIGFKNLINYGSHNSEICNTPKDIILFVKWSNVYSYSMSSQTLKRQVNFSGVFSVTSGCLNGSVVYIVTEIAAEKIQVYNSTWSILTSFGGLGSGDGQLDSS